ncbi:hypothetical protein SSYM_0552, partial [Serratia symbiotica str. Tucson]
VTATLLFGAWSDGGSSFLNRLK